jgi:metal-responsive CopG/Arc/MetJ family transcriptional regulator
MHVHVMKDEGVRTTIELTDRQRAKLLELAAERGEKGFSRLVQEAIDRYLEENAARRERVVAALAVGGTLDDAAADALEQSVRRMRGTWR